MRALHSSTRAPTLSTWLASTYPPQWLAKYDDVKGLINEYIPKGARVLLVGCGNSSLTADMAADGYRDLVSTDYSAVVIERMAAKHGDLGGCCKWEVADMMALPYADATFDAVLDKAVSCWAASDHPPRVTTCASRPACVGGCMGRGGGAHIGGARNLHVMHGRRCQCRWRHHVLSRSPRVRPPP